MKDSKKKRLRVATKYPNSAARYFQEIGKKVRIIKLYGAIELGPLTGLSDLICLSSFSLKNWYRRLASSISSFARKILNCLTFDKVFFGLFSKNVLRVEREHDLKTKRCSRASFSTLVRQNHKREHRFFSNLTLASASSIF